MDKKRISKKALRSLLKDSMNEAIGSLQLPEPGKKVKKLLDRNAKKLAQIYADRLKREEKKTRKAQKLMEDGVGTKKNSKRSKEVKLEGTAK